MMYNWTKQAADLKLTGIPVPIAKKLAPELVEEGKFKSDAEYFNVTVDGEALTQNDKFEYPNHGDVFIAGDDLYGLAKVLRATRKGKLWEFDLLIHKLKKEPYSEKKNFNRPPADA